MKIREVAVKSEMELLEIAYRAGQEARRSGLGKTANPYKEHPLRSYSEHSQWLRGWRCVRQEKET